MLRACVALGIGILVTACAAGSGGEWSSSGGGSGAGGGGGGNNGGGGSGDDAGSAGDDAPATSDDSSSPPAPPPPGGNGGVSCWSPDFNVTYNDGPSLCQFVNRMMQYYENAECGFNSYWPKQFTIDPALMAQAQNEANAVANGAKPKGVIECANWDAACHTGMTTEPDPVKSGDNWFYLDGANATNDPNAGFNSANLMFTAPESSLVINPDSGFSFADGGLIPELDCHFDNLITASRVWIYHYCPTTGPKPTRMGCGSAVDSNGKAWRVLLEAP
jgi:hypothetical protein